MTLPRPMTLLIGLAVLLALPFAVVSARQGIDGLDLVLATPTRFVHPEDGWASRALFVHMIAGAAVTVLALLQPVAAIRTRWPRVHRVSGRIVVGGALITAAGGLTYIARQGTVGGPGMSAGFALYGVLLGAAAVQTIRVARARDTARHRRWGLRLMWLAIGSWLYRVQYGLWYAATGGLASTEAFDGAFDRAMFVGFFLPQLLLLELYLRRRPAPSAEPS
ncbi:DUF2306 domain-containing protein [Jannaschia seohaensis]|uniref:Predicted membrane protein n=1 Tax=Jannaschia seohaensis TaxID=475081 RepID=A0A2Y9AWV1_9RHOB|nr:DUF2306 domain-containing protein [Jannaschia seohaensis]PWJ17028.1 putative membrane protein DUF2306 [Jannaschia seohaensis]SSA48365.1 Predicted membrane protein [Jannaschia seohaensis]